ncbi:MAG: YlxR family protein [Actinobacteria bacterium]|nr:MAG: YlxR family protein [Actinomycetota bacterium]
MPKARKTPLRSCVACRLTLPKRELIRIVRTPAGDVLVDPTGKMNGRGANVCPRPECFEQAVKTGSLARNLQVGLDKGRVDRLREAFSQLLEARNSQE